MCAVQECEILFEATCDYIEELQLMKDAHLQWLQEVVKKHTELLSADKKHNQQAILPKTPALKSRLRKRARQANCNYDEEQPLPSDKPPSLDLNVKKISICLERIDESPFKPVVEQPLKPKPPVKPPRALKSSKRSGSDQQMNLKSADADGRLSPFTTVTFTSSASVVLSQEKKKNAHHSQITCSPLRHNGVNQTSRDTFFVANPARLSNSRRRSSAMRQRLRVSARLSKRMSDIKRKNSTAQLQHTNLVNDTQISLKQDDKEFSSEELSKVKNQVEIGIVECEQAAIPNKVKIVKKGHIERGTVDYCDVDQLNNTHTVEGLTDRQLDNYIRNSENDSPEAEANDSYSPECDGSRDADSVISSTPSPQRPAKKTVHPKSNMTRSLRNMTGSLAANGFQTPVSSAMSKNLYSVSADCSKRHKPAHAKMSKNPASTSRKQHGNTSLNASRVSPQVMTPQEKQEKCLQRIKLRELKSQEVLRKRGEYIKKKIEDQRRKREAKLRQVIQAKELNSKQQEAKLLKLLEEDEKRKQIMLLKKKEHEERLAEQRKQMEERQAELQKQTELEKERQREIEREKQREKERQREMEKERQREMDKQRELEKERQRELIRQKEEMEKQKEQERIAIDMAMLKQAKEQKQLAEEQPKKKEKQKKLLAEKNLQQNVEEKPEKVAINQVNGPCALNRTITLDASINNNYDLTPQRLSPLPNVDPNNYDIDNMQEGDSTDDDEQPKKKIPAWAEGRAFKIAILEQLRKPVNIEAIFPPEELMLVPQLTDIFGTKKRRFLQRTSSAMWTSPLLKDGF